MENLKFIFLLAVLHLTSAEYYFSELKLNWFGATTLCKSINGGLLEVDDLSEHQFVSAELQKLHPDLSDLNVTYWTGLIDLREEGTFFWTDSKTRPEFDVWGPGSPVPNDRIRSCVGYHGFRVDQDTDEVIWMWQDQDCGEVKNHVICELTEFKN